MPKTITIRHLKSIGELTFTMPRPGVHLLSGSNGSGKTTLLACLRRIGHSNAFPLHFPASAKSENVDDFSAAQIIYGVDGQTVTYSYAGERWVPKPRTSSDVLDAFGYPDVRYAGATAERLTPRSEDIQPRKIHPAPTTIVDAANQIFETDRFTHLRTINFRGNGNQALLLVPPGPRRRYISERNFSLGELCVLKLLRAIEQCPNGSLVLIDELELALHPRAQMGLFEYLERRAREKALTVIVSTHSVTLIKYASRSQILFLEQRDGRTEVIQGCFPAYAIGELASSEERAPDVVIYVEDEAACAVTESLTKLVVAAKYPDGSGVFPTIQVTPIGDFKSVVRYYDRSRTLLPDYVRQWILLDNDVEVESLGIMANNSNHPMRDLFHEHSAKIRYLPWTPEVGLLQYLAMHRVDAERELRRRFGNGQLHIPPSMLTLPRATGAELRRLSKRAVERLVASLHNGAAHLKEEAITKQLYESLAGSYFRDHRDAAMQLLGPLMG